MLFIEITPSPVAIRSDAGVLLISLLGLVTILYGSEGSFYSETVYGRNSGISSGLPC